jgi:hypothetical protein
VVELLLEAGALPACSVGECDDNGITYAWNRKKEYEQLMQEAREEGRDSEVIRRFEERIEAYGKIVDLLGNKGALNYLDSAGEIMYDCIGDHELIKRVLSRY